MMAYTFDYLDARDPSNPAVRAANASVTIHAPGDATKTPLTITTTAGDPLANPITVSADGYGPAFMHATLDRVAWSGGGFTGFMTAYEGIKNEAVAARGSAEAAAATAGADAIAELNAQIAAGNFKGEKGADGSNVLPTDTAIKDAVNNTASATRGALNNLYALKGQAGGSITFVTLTAAGQAVSIPDGPVAGLALVQDSTGGRTAAWPAGVRWDGGTVPALSTGGGMTDVFTFVAVTGNGWLGKKDGSYAAPPAAADTAAPSAVTNLTAGTATDTTIPLSWTAATDNVGVTGYEYSLNGTTWTATGSTGTTYTVTGLTASTTYTISVRAFDAAGNKGSAVSVTKSTAAASATWVSMASDTFTAPDGTLVNGRTMETGGLTYSADPALTIQLNKADWGLADVKGFSTPTVTTGATRHRVSFNYDISRQKNGNEQHVIALVWFGGTRTGSAYSTAHQVKIAKPLYNSATATMTGTTPYSEALTITAQNGKDLTAVPLAGKLTVETQADGATINVLIDNVLWATVSKLAGEMTMGTQAYASMFGAYATMDNLLVEAYK